MKRTLTVTVGMIMSVFSGIKAQMALDVHSHNVFPEFISFLESKGAALEETFPLPEWDVMSHLKFMDESGINTSLLSMPAPQPYYGDSDECRRIIREYNDRTAEIKKEYPGKFLFCASLPLPDVDAAIDEAVYALDVLKADGIKLATNSRGQYLGDPGLDPLMQVLNDRKAVVILHPHKPTPVNDSIISVSPLAVYEYPAETTRAVVNMIANNVPARYPDIKFVIPHCGSFLPLALPRMKNVHKAMLAKGLMQEIDWDDNLKNLYFDLAGGATPEVLETLLSITDTDHLLYGSDYPYMAAPVLTKAKEVLQTTMNNNEKFSSKTEDILNGNAAKLFNLEKPYDK